LEQPGWWRNWGIDLTWFFIVFALIVKSLLWCRLAPATLARFVGCRRDWQWWTSQLCVNGQLIAALLMTAIGVSTSFLPSDRLIGAACFLVGYALHLAAAVVNPDFGPEIVTPREMCGHWLYRYLRHPGYIGLMLASFGQTLLLGHFLLIPFCAAYVGLLVYRGLQEEELLCQLTQGS